MSAFDPDTASRAPCPAKAAAIAEPIPPDAQKQALLGRIPAGKLGEGSDVAAAAVYLASREAAYVTGQTIHVNGGMAML